VKRDGENTTHGESVQPLQSVKLVYQPCSRSRAAWTSSRLDGSGWLGGSLVRERVVQLGTLMESKCDAWTESKCGLVL
jgi:hypothetical protein